ncbi:MAG: hypothetical protein AB2A00_36395 [Myxococcota bacterium]
MSQSIFVDEFGGTPLAPSMLFWVAYSRIARGEEHLLDPLRVHLETLTTASFPNGALLEIVNNNLDASLYLGDVPTWTPGTATLTTLATVPGFVCGMAVCHDDDGAYVLGTRDPGEPWFARWDDDAGVLGELTPTTLSTAVSACGVTCADLDGDGTDEVVSTPRNIGGVAVLSGAPDVGFTALHETYGAAWSLFTPQQHRPSFEDLDGNGSLDVALTLGGGIVALLFNNGNLAFDLDLDGAIADGEYVFATTAGRLGRDRVPYVILSHGRTDWAQVWRVNPDRTLVREDWITEKWGPSSVRLPMLLWDVDGDGSLDVLSSDDGDFVWYWRRPDREEEDGLPGPRMPVILDGGFELPTPPEEDGPDVPIHNVNTTDAGPDGGGWDAGRWD